MAYVELDWRHDAAIAYHGGLRPQHRRGVRHVHENQSADDRVEVSFVNNVVYITDNEANVVASEACGPQRRALDGPRRPFDAYYLAGAPDDIGDCERHVSYARSQVEDAHTGA